MSNSRLKTPKQPVIERYFNKIETGQNRASGSDKTLSSESRISSSGPNSKQHSLADKRSRQHKDRVKQRKTTDSTKMGVIFGKPDDVSIARPSDFIFFELSLNNDIKREALTPSLILILERKVEPLNDQLLYTALFAFAW